MSRIQIEKIQFVGEQLGFSEYEATCTLAEDCELRAGLIVPRFDDYQTTTSAAQRACMVDVSGGTLRWKNSSGYVFAYGDDAFFLNSDGQWTWVKPDGSEQTLQEPAAPTITDIGNHDDDVAMNTNNGTWNVTPNPAWPPTWSNISGYVARTYSFSSAKNWKGAAYFWCPIDVPSEADPTVDFYVNGSRVPGRVARWNNQIGWLIWDVRAFDCSSVYSVGFSYELNSTHTLVIRYNFYVEYGVPVGKHVYAVSVERNGIESVLSQPVTRTVGRRAFLDLDSGGVFVHCSVSSGQAGDIVRLYRAVEGQYVQVYQFTATGSYTSVNLYDKGDTAEGYYRPSGKLPYGPAVVAGNRAVVAAGRTLWISQAGAPTRFGATAINDDNQDAYTIILPAAIDAVVPAEGGVIAHTRRGQYLVPLSPQYDNDLLHLRPPALIDERAAGDFRAASFGAFISDGRLFVDGQVVASVLPNDAWVLRIAGRVYVIHNDSTDGWCLVWAPQEWQGALRWKLPHQVSWVFSYGDDVFICSDNGIYLVAGAEHRKSSCRWRTGKRFLPMLSAIRFIHLAGTGTVKIIRPGKPDVVLNNVSGRVNTPTQEQTHEWMLELSTSSLIYQCYISYETGIQ